VYLHDKFFDFEDIERAAPQVNVRGFFLTKESYLKIRLHNGPPSQEEFKILNYNDPSVTGLEALNVIRSLAVGGLIKFRVCVGDEKSNVYNIELNNFPNLKEAFYRVRRQAKALKKARISLIIESRKKSAGQELHELLAKCVNKYHLKKDDLVILFNQELELVPVKDVIEG